MNWKKISILSSIAISLISLASFYHQPTSGVINFYLPTSLLYFANTALLLITFCLYQAQWSKWLMNQRFFGRTKTITEWLFIFSLIAVFANQTLGKRTGAVIELIAGRLGQSVDQMVASYQRNFSWLESVNSYLQIAAVISGMFLLWISYINTIKFLSEKERETAAAARKKRYEYIQKKIIFWRQIGFLKNILGWLKKNGLRYHSVLLIVSLFFIGLKIWLPLTHPVSYVDEYFHLSAGLNYFNTGEFAQFYASDGPYDRGAIMTLTAGLFLKIFGQNLLVAKMAPALFGIINYFLFYLVVRRVVNNRKIVILAMMIFTAMPWTLFNHFYIRFYVLYESALLLILYLFFFLIDAMKAGKNKKALVGIILIAIVNAVVYWSSHDAGQYIILIVTLVSASYLIISTTQKKLQSWKNFSSANRLLIFLGSVGIIAAFLFIITKAEQQWYMIFHGRAAMIFYNTKYAEFFLKTNFMLAIFSAFSLPVISITANRFKKIVIINSSLLLLLHLLTNPDMQIIRSILYFMPLLMIAAAISLDNFYYLFKRHQSIWLYGQYLLLIMIFAASIYDSYPKNFIKNPYIYGEIEPRDYQAGSRYVKERLDHYLIIDASHGLEMSYQYFHNLKIDYHLDLNNHNLWSQDQMQKWGGSYDPFYFDRQNQMYSLFLKKPSLTDTNIFRQLLAHGKVAVILTEFSRWQFFTNETYYLMTRSLPYKKEFLNYYVYHN